MPFEDIGIIFDAVVFDENNEKKFVFRFKPKV